MSHSPESFFGEVFSWYAALAFSMSFDFFSYSWCACALFSRAKMALW
jgi:hypothetical protein